MNQNRTSINRLEDLVKTSLFDVDKMLAENCALNGVQFRAIFSATNTSENMMAGGLDQTISGELLISKRQPVNPKRGDIVTVESGQKLKIYAIQEDGAAWNCTMGDLNS